MLLPPINFIFKLLQQHSIVQIWLYEQVRNISYYLGALATRTATPTRCIILIDPLSPQLAIRIEGKIRGFDEFMNLVIDDAVEVKQITKTNDKEERKNLGAQLLPLLGTADLIRANPVHRPNPAERRQRVFDPELVRLINGNILSDEISVQRTAQSRGATPGSLGVGSRYQGAEHTSWSSRGTENGRSIYLIRYGCLDVSIPQDQPVQRLIKRPDRDLVCSRGQELLLEAQAIEQYRRFLSIQRFHLLGVPLEKEVIETPAMPKSPDFF